MDSEVKYWCHYDEKDILSKPPGKSEQDDQNDLTP